MQSNDAFGVEEKADIEVLARGKKLFAGAWAVQIYVTDRGTDRLVQLVALGDSAFAKFSAGMAQDRHFLRESPNLGVSKKIRNEIANALA